MEPAELVCSCIECIATLKSCRTHGGMWMTQCWNPQSGHQTSVDSSGAQYICNTRITCCCNHSYAMCGASSTGSDVWSLCRLWRLPSQASAAGTTHKGTLHNSDIVHSAVLWRRRRPATDDHGLLPIKRNNQLRTPWRRETKKRIFNRLPNFFDFPT